MYQYIILFFIIELNLIPDSYDGNNNGSGENFEIKKNSTGVKIIHKKKVIYCSCLTNKEDGLMIQVTFNSHSVFFFLIYNILYFALR